MADQGFSGYMSDFAATMKENGEDILATTQDLEKLFTDTLDFLADKDKLEEMTAQIQDALETMLEQLEAGSFFSIGSLEKLFDDIIEQIRESLGIDLDLPLDPKKLFQSISQLIPEDVFPEDLKKIYQRIKNFFENIDLSDVRISVKGVNEPVPKPKASAPTGSALDAIRLEGMPSNFDVFSPSGSTNPPDSNSTADAEALLNQLVNQISATFLNKQAIIDSFLEKLEGAVVSSGFFRELDEKQEAFIKSVTSKSLSIRELFKSLTQLVADLIATALRSVSNLLDAIFDDLEAFIQMIRDLLTLKPGALIGALLERFGVQGFNPSILSLPAFLMAVPYTLLNKALTGERPQFPSVFQDATADNNNIVYGSMQILKSFLPFLGLASDRLSSNHPKWAVATASTGDLIGPVLDVVAQFYSEPLHPDPNKKDHFGYAIWYFQWGFNVAWGVISCIINLIFGIKSLDDNWKNQHDRLITIKDTILPVLQAGAEIVHFGLFLHLYNLEKEAEDTRNDLVPINDSRTRNGYMLDAIPGIAGGLIALPLVFVNRKLDAEKLTAAQRANQAKRRINTSIQTLRSSIGKIFPLKDQAELIRFFGPLNNSNSYGDLVTYLPLINTGFLQPVGEIRGLLKAINSGNPGAAIKRRAEELSNLLDLIPGEDHWKSLIDNHKRSKPAIVEFREDTTQLLTAIQSSLNTLGAAVGRDDFNAVKLQINNLKSLAGWAILQKWTSEATGKISGIASDVRRNSLLGSLFNDNAGRVSLITASNNIKQAVDQLIAVLADDNVKRKLKQEKDKLSTHTATLAGKKIRVVSLLRLFPRSNRSVRGKSDLFPPLGDPLETLEKMWSETERIANAGEELRRNTNPAKVRDLERGKYGLMAADILITLSFQIVYGSLYINTGVHPPPPPPPETP